MLEKQDNDDMALEELGRVDSISSYVRHGVREIATASAAMSS